MAPLFCPGYFPSPVRSNTPCDECGNHMKSHDSYEGTVDGEDWGDDF